MLPQTVNIFVNPIAGRGRGKAISQRLGHRLTADGYQVRIWFDPPPKIADEPLSVPSRASIVIGGDGTIRAVADRFLSLNGSIPPILPVPLGTANLIVRHLGFNWRSEGLEANVSEAIAAAHLTWLDAGSANGQLFLVLASVGYDAAVVHELNRVRNGPITMLSYILPAWTALRDYPFPSLRVIADGREIWSPGPALAFVGSAKEYGAGFSVLPFAEANDGKLDVCVLPCRSREELVRIFLEALAEQHIWSPGVKYRRAKSIRIESDQQTPIEIDGDAAGFTPLDVSLLPVRLPFIVASH